MADTIAPNNIETILTEAIKSVLESKFVTPNVASVASNFKKKFEKEKQDMDETIAKRKTSLVDHLEKRRLTLTEDTIPENNDVKNGYIFAGKIIDETDGEPIPFTRVRIMDLDRKSDDTLGVVTTDSKGEFSLFYTREDFKDADAIPEIYVEILGERDKVIMRTDKSMIEKTPKNAWYEITVDSEKLPDAVKKSKGVLSNLKKKKAERLSKLTTVTTLEKPEKASFFTSSIGFDSKELIKVTATKSTKSVLTVKTEKKTLNDVTGLGKTYIKKLKDNKITTVKSLAVASTDRISKALNISVKKADSIRSNAQALLE